MFYIIIWENKVSLIAFLSVIKKQTIYFYLEFQNNMPLL
jgi:hypothetical protein